MSYYSPIFISLQLVIQDAFDMFMKLDKSGSRILDIDEVQEGLRMLRQIYPFIQPTREEAQRVLKICSRQEEGDTNKTKSGLNFSEFFK